MDNNHLLPFFPTLRSLRFLPIREPRGLADFFPVVASGSALGPTLPSEEAMRRFLGEGSSEDGFELLCLLSSCSRFLLFSIGPGVVATCEK
jgi:hypothetical protein